MSTSSFINNAALRSKLSDIISKYDTDNNGFTKKEFRSAVLGITNTLAKGVVKLTGYDKKIFKEMNIDNNDVVSYDELAIYVKKEFGLDFNSFTDMTLKEICDAIDTSKKNNNASIMRVNSNLDKFI